MSRKTNYHCHTSRCHHARGSDEAYVREAIKNGYDVLGFSDHACWNYNSSFCSRIRMQVKEFDEYARSVRTLQRKYSGQIEIFLGMEAEYFPAYMPWLQAFCLEKGIDYLILGNHYENSDEYGIYYGYAPEEKLKSDVDSCIAGMETGMYAYLAHPDLPFRNETLEWNEDTENQFRRLCTAARDLQIPLEYNVLGLQESLRDGIETYPKAAFWKLAAKTGNTAIIGMDAHQPADLNRDLFQLAEENLKTLGITRIETLSFPDFRRAKCKHT